MKANKIHHGRRSFLAIAGLVLVTAAGVAIMIGYEKLRDAWLEQCVVRSMAEQVEIESGKMVKADVIAENLGLRPGANLATIDFEAKRAAMLKKIPNLRDVKISRRLPDKVTVAVEERTPVVRLGVRGVKKSSDRVADTEGVVFLCARGTGLLPIIRETNPPGAAPGHRLEGRARAALRLVEASREPDFQEMGLLDVDLSKIDYLSATLSYGSRYSTLKIAWEDMDEPETPASNASLARQLRHTKEAMSTPAGEGVSVWNATDYSYPGRVFADTKGKL
ncbi:MAG: FtsQ-type POTRA domain-containing protein [Kiritimatiellae bacterium]|nr:FtsQ-type POTRA domain-containing protein [Kiritimatiellia bacterium]